MKKAKIDFRQITTEHKFHVFLTIFSIIGLLAVLATSAAAFSISIESEASAPSNLVINDQTASGANAVQFGVVTPTSGLRPIPDTLYGVTIESVSQLSSITDSLDRHTQMPTTRIVFQDGMNVSDYTNAINQIYSKSYIMGEILDSTGLESISTENYKTRARNFVNAFSGKVDIWEIGNELNGEWVGQPADIRAKAQAAYDVVEKENASLNLRSAITLNYWPSTDCYSYSWEDTETFANSLSTEIKNGIDYVLLSFYETACSPRAKPTNQQFITIFNKLKTIFPNAKIGMGEIGAQGKDDGLSSDPSLSEKQTIANRYYGMHNALKEALGPRYVGGYFWWYYYQDAVPYNKSQSMWQTIEDNFSQY